MKKHLALVLALVMVLTSFSFVSAAPDFADVQGTVYENAVNRLELLEILKGYPDGTFKPEDSITRAEFATVAVRARGLAGVAATSAGLPSGFSDVPTWHWASGFIGTAASTGIVEGIGNGLFAPAAPVRYEEAVTMLVRALGYEPEARSKGGYPYGYLVVAEEIGLLDGASSTTGTFASRGMVALLTDNALEIPMMVSIGFGNDVRWVVSGSAEHGGEEIYLLSKLGVDEVEGIVMENFRVNSRLDADEIVVYDLSEEKNVTLEVSGSVDVDAILGLEVTAWAKDDVVFSVTVDTDADLVAYDTVASPTEDEVDLVVLDDTFDWAVRDENYGDATVYVNNVEEDVEDAVGFGRVVMNEDDEIVFAYLFDVEANNYGVITEIDDTDMEYISVGSRDADLLELDDAEEIYVFTKEFAAASLDDLTEDMSVFFWIDSDDNYYIVAFDNMVEGTLEEVRTTDSRINVEGTNYSVATVSIFSDDAMDSFMAWNKTASVVTDYVDEEVIVYLDYAGKAMVMITDDAISSDVYGLATWVSIGRTNTLTVFNAEGEEVTYDFASRNLPNPVTYFDGVKNSTTPAAIGVMVELDKDAEITTYSAINSDQTIVKQADREYINLVDGARRYITEDTVILKAYNSKGELKPSVIEYEDLVDLSFGATDAMFLISEGSDLGLLVFTDKNFSATDETMYAIASGDRFVRGGDYRIELDVVGEGKAVYTLSNSDAIKKGDLVTFEMNNNGEAVFAVVKSLGATTGTVTETLRNFIEVENVLFRVTSDTLFYKTATDSNTKLDGTTSFARIEKDDEVLVLDNGADGDAMVVVVVTALRGETVVVPAELSLSGNISTTTSTAIDVIFKNDTTEPVEFNNATIKYRLYNAGGALVGTEGSITGVTMLAARGAVVELAEINLAAQPAPLAGTTVTMVVDVMDGADVLYTVTKTFAVPVVPAS